MAQIVSEPWFWGSLSTTAAEQLFAIESLGTFLVRFNELVPGEWIISCVLKVEDPSCKRNELGLRIKHFHLRTTSQKQQQQQQHMDGKKSSASHQQSSSTKSAASAPDRNRMKVVGSRSPPPRMSQVDSDVSLDAYDDPKPGDGEDDEADYDNDDTDNDDVEEEEEEEENVKPVKKMLNTIKKINTTSPLLSSNRYHKKVEQDEKKEVNKKSTKKNKKEEDDEEEIEEEESSSGDGKKGSNGLYDTEINKIMEPYKKDGYIGTFARDDFSKIIPTIKKNQKNASFILNTDVSSGPGMHWQAVNITPKAVEFYDSFGREPTPDVEKNLGYVAKRMFPKKILPIIVNKVKVQDDRSSNCGHFCMKFLIDRYKELPFVANAPKTRTRDAEKNIKKFKKQIRQK